MDYYQFVVDSATNASNSSNNSSPECTGENCETVQSSPINALPSFDLMKIKDSPVFIVLIVLGVILYLLVAWAMLSIIKMNHRLKTLVKLEKRRVDSGMDILVESKLIAESKKKKEEASPLKTEVASVPESGYPISPEDSPEQPKRDGHHDEAGSENA